ncbi:DUF3331 domain-containing protein [Burkholderia multivorans]|uniref:DUF3331 domain-containing protein n=2 Tax=Burkholderia multivorans TaxID=87883 RepID=UPI0005B834DB|nr:DUF3331 domain-containing protein [Burkholderia multivorans]MBJ9654073.1 DUF3331 domain-containing protein [Burkholderia multivorans]MBR8045184.1 DUF3331 domain-containing protein [Burkholderia multivorans]MBU9470536.1 DUF3331 domain-containing protein [Burkholderia multivorans]MBU9517587.1 DUF3331 domain-containing protein [Burkholderia multivorans]MBU9547354.1 DUF3331 domain-containing protein [Burkholderia multivorans]
MTQPTCVHDDVFERALMRLLDPSRVPATGDGAAEAMDRSGRLARQGRGKAAEDDGAPPRARIRIVEILSSSSVSVRWSDPQSGYFGEQVWHCVTARTSSQCVLTGMPINRGDRVYRPRGRGRSVPCNWARMIHAAAVASFARNASRAAGGITASAGERDRQDGARHALPASVAAPP